MSGQPGQVVTLSRAQVVYRSWFVDTLLYVVVLNLFVEYAAAVVIDSFTISVFTALLLKAILDVLTAVEHRVRAILGRYSRVLALLATWLILFASKFLILELVDIVFGEHVELGGFLDVIVLVVVLMLAGAGARWFDGWLGRRAAARQ